MTIDEIKMLNSIDEIETRAAAIRAEMEAPEADLEALKGEAEELTKRAAEIRAAQKADIDAVIAGAGKTVGETPKEKKMDIKELRASHDYNVAYAEYLKTGDDKQVRSLLTELATPAGDIPVPQLIENRIRTAWENDEIMSRVTKSYIKGVLRIGFEVSASGAVPHLEGGAAISDEELVLGIATLLPLFLKKTITISDEVYSLTGEEFLDYLYDEFEYQITLAASNMVVSSITAAATASQAQTPSKTIPYVGSVFTANVAGLIGDLFLADAQLSGAARDVVLIINRATYADIMATVINSQTMTAADVFGRYSAVLFTDQLKTFGTAQGGEAIAIVGDLRAVQVNMPNGDGVKFTFDDITLATSDMIRLTGKLYAGIGVVEPKKLAVVSKEA